MKVYKLKNSFAVVFVVLVALLVNINVSYNNENNKYSQIELGILSKLAHADSESSSQCQSCAVGGPGTASCTLTMGIVTYSVDCQSGYYACCKGTGASCCG